MVVAEDAQRAFAAQGAEFAAKEREREEEFARMAEAKTSELVAERATLEEERNRKWEQDRE